MKSTDVAIVAAPFGFGPTGKSIAIARELIRRGYSVKILGDQNTLKLVKDAGILANQYEYRTELNLADLRSKVVVSYLDVSTKIINKSNVPLVLGDISQSSNRQIFDDEAAEAVRDYLPSDNFVENRFPLDKDGAQEIVDYLERYLRKETVKNAYYRVSVKAKIIQNCKVLLVKEDGKKWDLPGGGVEHQESIEDALRRELKEEIGVDDFVIKNGPRIFKMIDEAANRPLLFLVYEIEPTNDAKIAATKNTRIGLFTAGDAPETVAYSPEYAEYITNFRQQGD